LFVSFYLSEFAQFLFALSCVGYWSAVGYVL